MTEEGDNFIAPNASVIGQVTLKHSASVWFNAVLRGDNDHIVVGPRSNIQDSAVLHTDEGMPLTLGEGVSVGHLGMLHGCTVGDFSLIGIRATVLNGATIGKECLVGAHALVTEGKTFPDRCLLLGAPARIARHLSDEEVANLRWIAAHYVEQNHRYRSRLQSP